MKIKVIINNVILDENNIAEQEIDISGNNSLQEMLDVLGYGIADVSEYYKCSGVFTWNTCCCPYIISNDGILYNVLFDQIKLKDFIKTHGISNNTIKIVVGYPQAGGPGFNDLKDIWDAVQPYLNDIAIVSTILGVNCKTVIDWFRKFFEKKKVSPHAVMDIISSRKQWNHKELANILNVPQKNTKYLLKAFGYRYDKKLMQYVSSKETEELIEKISSVQVLDI